MKGFNVFLAIVIFLLAVVSSVFSFFLFEKRAQLVNDYNTTTTFLQDASSAIDKDSGTQVGQNVTVSALDHSQKADVPAILGEFKTQVETLVKQRNAQADALSKIASTLEKSGMPSSSFRNFKSYASSITQLNSHVSAYRTRNDYIIGQVVSFARLLEASNVSVSGLKSNSYKTACQNLTTRINFWRNRHNSYKQKVSQTFSALRGSGSLPQSDSSYNADLGKLLNQAQAVIRDLDKTKAALRQALSKIQQLQAEIKQRDNKIAQLEATIKKKDNEILRLSRICGLEVPKKLMDDGSREAMQLVKTQQKGRVIEVSDKFGYVVISLGSNTRVQDPHGTKVHHVDPQIPSGAILTVARDMGTGEAVYINKIKIVRLEGNASIAEPVDKATGKRMLIGDMVYLADDEIEKLLKRGK